jgi:chitinase
MRAARRALSAALLLASCSSRMGGSVRGDAGVAADSSRERMEDSGRGDAAARRDGTASGKGSDAGSETGAETGLDGVTVETGVDTGTDGGTGTLLRTIIGGYYPNWTPSPPRIRDVDPHYNLIYLFAATPVGGSPGNGNIVWTAPGDGQGAATNLVADIAYARQTQARKIIMSVGGAGNTMSFPDRATSQAFVTSVGALYTELGGFDGIDWDSFEGETPDTTEIIWMSLQLKSMYPGFMITAPPAPWNDVDMTFCSDMATAGALDYCAPQYYDGPGLAEESYVVSNAAQWITLLGASKFVVGFGVWDNQANYMTIPQAVSAWQAVRAMTPTTRGAFDWQIDVDYGTGWPFALQVGPLVNP